MAYTKQTWQDLPSKTTPINASRLGHIEQGIYDAASTADTAASNASSALSGLDDKVDKVTGKGLSTNDFTDALKTKLDNVEAGAEVNVQSDWNEADSSSDAFILNKPTLGTSAYKNSTSVVTQSSDLVESGAVFDVVKGSVGFVAGRNIAPITLDVIKASNTRGTWNGNVYTDRGVTYTVNDDLSISMSGTATGGNSSIALLPTTPIAFLDVGSYFMSGCPSGGNVETYYLNYAPRPSGSHIRDTGDGLLINNATANQGYNIYFIALEGTDVTGKVLKAQLEKGTSATPYYPYHASVSDSLEQKADNSVIGTVEGANASKAWSVGEHFISGGQFKEVTNPIASGEAIDSGNTTDKPIADCLVYKTGDSITGNFICHGHLTFSSKQIFAVINLPREVIANGFNCTVNTIMSRGVAGYLIPNESAFTDYKFKLKYIGGAKNSLVMVIMKNDETAFSGTNNTPTTTEINLSITFT